MCKEEAMRSNYEEPGPSFLRIMVSEQFLEKDKDQEMDEISFVDNLDLTPGKLLNISTSPVRPLYDIK